MAVEIGDWHRFTGNTTSSLAGLVPSERSSGSSRAQGAITKTGTPTCGRPGRGRWHQHGRYPAGKTMRDRWHWPLQPASLR